jgi:cell wall-associated NlpC family hydrolase
MKQFIKICLILFALKAAAQDSNVTLNYSFEDSLINLTCKNLGKGYQYGASGKDFFDCSGLVHLHFNKKGFPRSSREIAKLGEYVEADSLQIGDLIFFQGRNPKEIGHVAIVSHVSGKDIYILHATTSKGVVEEVLQKNDYFMKRWVFNKRITF